MKRTFVVPDDKETLYEQFKASVPEVSSKLVEFMEEFVSKLDATSKQMTEQTIFDGIEHLGMDIFQGDTLKFYGVSISKGEHAAIDGIFLEVFLTKKGKFLVAISDERVTEGEFKYSYNTYDDYFDMKAKAGLTKNLISQCEAYLNKNSVVRTFKVLDV